MIKAFVKKEFPIVTAEQFLISEIEDMEHKVIYSSCNHYVVFPHLQNIKINHTDWIVRDNDGRITIISDSKFKVLFDKVN